MSRKKRKAKRRLERPVRRIERGEPSRYPSPAERERIIQQRDNLARQLIYATVAHPGDTSYIERLARQYGPQEVAFVVNAIQTRSAETELISDEATIYRHYRRAFARFGGDRPFLSMQEYGNLNLEHGKLIAPHMAAPGFFEGITYTPGPRERELRDLLLTDVGFGEDLIPPAVPPRPADFKAPLPGHYDDPVQELLTWGWDLDEQRAAQAARNVAWWRPAIPDLVRMVLDEGLLHGWPGEAPSWAPYHALHVLGYLRAHEVAGQLLALPDQKNDWLSDKLPTVWARMGPQAEPPLWEYLSNSQHAPPKRGLVLLGLATIAATHPARRSDIVGRFVRLLQRAPADDAEANAYIVYVLKRLEAVEATQAISAAFAQGKVDTSIVAPYDIDFLPPERSQSL
jgi:hypothetical protein